MTMMGKGSSRRGEGELFVPSACDVVISEGGGSDGKTGENEGEGNDRQNGVCGK